MFPVLLAEEDCSIKRGQPSITRDLPKSSSFLAEVFLTQSVNSTFRAFWLAPVTRNILGYSLICDRSQDGVSLRDISEHEIWTINEAVVQTNTKKATNFASSVSTGMGRKLFSCWTCNKIEKCTWQKFTRMFVNCKKKPIQWHF